MISFKVCYSDPVATSEAGFGKVADLPFIVDARPAYHRPGSRYLIDRGVGTWNPQTRGRSPRVARPSRKTIKNYAHWLANFLEWVEVRGIDLNTCEYVEHVQGRYQEEMISGAWSSSGNGLSAKTVNSRVQQACDFLTWMSDKGMRPPFDLPTEKVKISVSSAMNSHGHRAMEISRRIGSVRHDKRRLRMPSHAEVGKWLNSVYDTSGYAMGLACETILLTALRLTEVASLRINTLPEDPRSWHLTNPDAEVRDQQVLISVKYGTKGPDYGEHQGDKVGPERSILIPLTLATKWHDYRQRIRNKALRIWINRASDLATRKVRIANTVHLFLHERTGKNLTADNVYRAWKEAELPFRGWSPHLGRDWWACSVLIREMEHHKRYVELGIGDASQLLESVGITAIRLKIQPQLGHKHEATSLIYLQWIIDRYGVAISVDDQLDIENK